MKKEKVNIFAEYTDLQLAEYVFEISSRRRLSLEAAKIATQANEEIVKRFLLQNLPTINGGV